MMRRWCAALGTAAVLTALLAPIARADDDAKPKDTKKADAKKADKAIVAVFRLDGEVSEQPAGEELPFGNLKKTSLKDLLERMRKAADDPQVKAVVVLDEGASIGTAQKEEIRQAMAKVRAAGKEVFAHADSLH